MKKTYLKNILGVVAGALLMTSCLGETGTTFESSKTLGYIKKGEKSYQNMAVLQASTYSVLLGTNAEVQNLKEGRFYQMSYKFDTKNDKLNADGAFISNSLRTIEDGYPVPQGGVFEVKDDLSGIEKQVHYITQSQLKPTFIFIDEFVNDQWVFNFSAEVYQEDKVLGFVSNQPDERQPNISLTPVLIKNKQYNETTDGGIGAPLQDDQVIVDIYLTRRKGDLPFDPNKPKVPFNTDIALDLSGLRTHLRSRINFAGSTDIAKDIKIRFRYYIYDKGTKKVAPAYVGSFTEGSRDTYVMRFYNPDKK